MLFYDPFFRYNILENKFSKQLYLLAFNFEIFPEVICLKLFSAVLYAIYIKETSK